MKLAETLDDHAQAVGRYAWYAAWFSLALSVLHTLARHGTEDGRSDLDSTTTAFWAEPAADLLRPLLDWAHPVVVYTTYGKLWLVVFLAYFLCAVVVQRRRQATGFERWMWRIVVTVYALEIPILIGEYWTQWGSETNALLVISFAAAIPVVLVGFFATSLLGIALLRNGFRPRASAWLLTIYLPFAFVITEFMSFGAMVLPISFAFAVAGRRLMLGEGIASQARTRRTPTAAATSDVSPVQTR
jgi:hypothetical protein